MGMAHQSLDCPKVIPVVEEGRGKRMPHHVRMNPLLDQCLFYHALDETVNSFRGQPPFLVGTMFPQRLEEGTVRICSVTVCLQIVLHGKKGLGLQRNSPESLPLADHIDNGLIAVGLEIFDLEAANFGLSQSSGEKGEQDKDKLGSKLNYTLHLTAATISFSLITSEPNFLSPSILFSTLLTALVTA